MASPKALATQLADIDAASLGDEDRQMLIRESRRLHNRLLSPAERVTSMVWTEPWTLIAVKIAMDMSLFTILQRGPMPCRAVAEAVGADPLLVSTQDILVETGIETYRNTAFAEALVDPKGLRNGFEHFYEIGIPQLDKAPGYLKKTGWQTPDDTANAPFGHINGRQNWLEQNPQVSEHFNLFLGSVREPGLQAWCDFYPFKDRLLPDLDRSKPLVVDVGGGDGSELRSLYSRLPVEYQDGTLVLQEQAHVIAQVRSAYPSSNVILSEHDFFQPQPPQFRGAQVYTMGFILHDWPDKQALQILKHVKDAMTPDYSMLILHEAVLPNRVANFHPRAAAMDLNMMAHFGALERTRDQWQALLEKAGLRVTDIFDSREGGHSSIEAVLDASECHA